MKVCTQSAVMTIQPAPAAPLDWTTLVWAQISGGGVGDFNGSGGDITGDGPVWFNSGEVKGTLTYNGPAQNSVMNTSGVFKSSLPNPFFIVTISLGAVVVFTLSFNGGTTGQTYPFTIPDTVGSQIVTVDVTWNKAGGGFGLANV